MGSFPQNKNGNFYIYILVAVVYFTKYKAVLKLKTICMRYYTYFSDQVPIHMTFLDIIVYLIIMLITVV